MLKAALVLLALSLGCNEMLFAEPATMTEPQLMVESTGSSSRFVLASFARSQSGAVSLSDPRLSAILDKPPHGGGTVSGEFEFLNGKVYFTSTDGDVVEVGTMGLPGGSLRLCAFRIHPDFELQEYENSATIVTKRSLFQIVQEQPDAEARLNQAKSEREVVKQLRGKMFELDDETAPWLVKWGLGFSGFTISELEYDTDEEQIVADAYTNKIRSTFSLTGYEHKRMSLTVKVLEGGKVTLTVNRVYWPGALFQEGLNPMRWFGTSRTLVSDPFDPSDLKITLRASKKSLLTGKPRQTLAAEFCEVEIMRHAGLVLHDRTQKKKAPNN